MKSLILRTFFDGFTSSGKLKFLSNKSFAANFPIGLCFLISIEFRLFAKSFENWVLFSWLGPLEILLPEFLLDYDLFGLENKGTNSCWMYFELEICYLGSFLGGVAFITGAGGFRVFLEWIPFIYLFVRGASIYFGLLYLSMYFWKTISENCWFANSSPNIKAGSSIDISWSKLG